MIATGIFVLCHRLGQYFKSYEYRDAHSFDLTKHLLFSQKFCSRDDAQK